MKKLMIAATVALVAIASQASSFQWKMKAGTSYKDGFDQTDATFSSLGAGYIGYLFNADSISQQEMLNLFNADGATAAGLAAKAIQYNSAGVTSGFSSGKTAITPFQTTQVASEETLRAYMVVFTDLGDGALGFAQTKDGKNAIMISDIGTGPYYESQQADVTIGTSAGTYSTKLYNSATFGENGWYAQQVSDVPEPTSGLLLLLGVAGLALRRKQK